MGRKSSEAETPEAAGTEQSKAPPERTSTLTEAEHPGVSLAPRAPATSLRFFGRPTEPLPLPDSKRVFTIGAGACDLVIKRALSEKVSSFHAMLTRVADVLRVEDQDSKNGSFAARGEPRLSSFEIWPGRSFWLGDVRLLPMNTHLEVLRPLLAWRLGLDRDDLIDDALEVIASGAPLALVGPAGTEAALLARAIHDASAWRNHFYLPITAGPLPALDAAMTGTITIDLDAVPKLPASYCKRIFGKATGLRTIVLATTDHRVGARLDTYREAVTTIPLPPLAQRSEDILRLIAMDWIARRSRHRVESLGKGIDGLTKYAWPGNLTELRTVSVRLLAYREHGSLRTAAASLGIKHQSLLKHFRRIGFELPHDQGA